MRVPLTFSLTLISCRLSWFSSLTLLATVTNVLRDPTRSVSDELLSLLSNKIMSNKKNKLWDKQGRLNFTNRQILVLKKVCIIFAKYSAGFELMFEKWFVKKINYTLNFEEILKKFDVLLNKGYSWSIGIIVVKFSVRCYIWTLHVLIYVEGHSWIRWPIWNYATVTTWYLDKGHLPW